MAKSRRYYSVGDLVRFPDGKVDWEVADARPHPIYTGIQKLVLRSGMSDRVLNTSNQRVIPREEAMK